MPVELIANRLIANRLIENSYGKSAVRLMKVRRHPDRHELFEVTVDIACEGDLAAAYTAGDNSRVLATDTMKNTVYALAREHECGEIEHFGLLLGRHFLDHHRQLTKIVVTLAARPWARIEAGGAAHPHAFQEAGAERRRAVVTVDREGFSIQAGLVDLLVLKTSGSGFVGFPRDRYTTLPEVRDRIFATRLEVDWRYSAGVDFGAAFAGIRRQLLATFATHESESVQHTLHALGEAVLAGFPAVEEIHLVLPNKHYLLVDLKPFGLTNDNEIFVATDEPYGRIEGRLRRG